MGVVSLVFCLVLGLWFFFCCWLAGFEIFGFLGGVGVGVKFALGRDDIQIRRNVYFMVFWYAVLQFKVYKLYLILVKSQIGSSKWIFLLRIVWVLFCGFYMCVFFF